MGSKSALSGCFLLLCFQLWAQDPWFWHIRAEEGLPSEEVYSITQDNQGFIWIGCDAGLFRYNGVSFQHYANSGQRAAAVSGITADQEDRIFCYNFSNQLFYTSADSLVEIHSWQGKRKEGFSRISVDLQGRLWASSRKYLYCYDLKSQSWDSLFLENQNALVGPTNILASKKDNTVWSYIEDEIISVQAGNLKRYPVQFVGEDSRNLGDYIFFFADSALFFVGMNNSTVYYEKDSVFLPYPSRALTKALEGRKPTHISAQEKFLYFCTYSGLVGYDMEKDSVFILFPDESFSGLLKDKEGNFWLTTLKNGIYFIPELDFRVWNRLPGNRITDLSLTDSLLYFSMLNGHLGWVDLLKNVIHTRYSGLSSDIRTLFFHPASGSVLFNQYKEIVTMVPDGEFAILPTSFGPVKRMTIVDDYLIVCTSFGTAVYHSPSDEEPVSRLTEAWSRDVAWQSSQKTLFIATNNGLEHGLFQDGFLGEKTLFSPGVQFRSIKADPKTEEVFAVNFRGELFSFQNGTFQFVSRLPGNILPNDLLITPEKIFVATNKGLWIYEKTSGEWSARTRYSGLASEDIARLALAYDRLWLATSRGLQSLPLHHEISKPLPEIVLRELRVDNASGGSDLLEFPYLTGFTVFAEGVSYISQGHFRYAWKLNEEAEEWNFVDGREEFLRFSGLPPGKFSLEIRVVDYLGRFSENAIRLNGMVIPPFWQRWWFYFLIMLSAGAGTFAAFRTRIALLKKRQLRELEKLRMENNLRLLRQSALKARMNPHFIFNVLNSIKAFIYENDKKNAVGYLNRFSDLMRKVLHYSGQELVTLEEEIATLELYIHLEGLLLGEDFSWTMEKSEELNPARLQIPALLIQPFVENAFKHGLRHRTGPKILILRILQEQSGILNIEITDNGIGRAAAAKFNSQSHRDSFATAASEQRINLLNAHREGTVGLEIEDLFHQDGSAAGTKVTLKLSVREKA